ncbi:MAG: hypothetical protein ACLSVD_14000 [Eggerthellaceae bacterium]
MVSTIWRVAPVHVLDVHDAQQAAREKTHGVQHGHGAAQAQQVRAHGHGEDVAGEPRDGLYGVREKERRQEECFFHICYNSFTYMTAYKCSTGARRNRPQARCAMRSARTAEGGPEGAGGLFGTGDQR